MFDRDRLIALHLEALAELGWTPPTGWIAQFQAGEVLPLSRAAEIAGADAETVRRWCIAAEYSNAPLGYQVGGLWLVDAGELLRQVEARRDENARRAAEVRLEEYRKRQTVKLLGRAAG